MLWSVIQTILARGFRARTHAMLGLLAQAISIGCKSDPRGLT